MKGTHVLFSSKSDNWSTPASLFSELDEEFHFTLDPCADALNHKCHKYFTVEDDGLAQTWAGEVVFCNPPYGRRLHLWVRKAFEEAQRGALVCLLIPARTDTAFFHDYILPYAEIRFLRGRLKFGLSEQNAPFPSMVCVFRPF